MRKNLIIAVLVLAMLLPFVGCKRPIDNYKGGIVIEKIHVAENAGYKVGIQYPSKDEKSWPYTYIKIYVTKYDYNRFNEGDTIK